MGEELPAAALEAAGLGALADRHPRDLSGGQRQRLALAIVLQGEPPAVVCLDEPTRGMDRGHKDALAAHLRELAAAGTAVLVATHDAEFAALWAERTVLLGDGAPVADAPTAEVLGGGWYFATQTARILGGCALLPEEGAALLRAPAESLAAGRAEVVAVSWLAASLVVLGLALVAGFAWYERTHPTSRVLALVATLAALAALGRIAFAPLPNVKPTTDIVLLTGYALGGAPGFAVGAVAALASERVLRPGAVDAVADVRVGRRSGSAARCSPRVAGRELGRAALAVACGLAGAFFGAVMNLSLWVTFSGDHSLAKLGAVLRDVAAVRPRPRRRQRRVLPRLRPRARARAHPLPAALRGQLAPGARARGRRPRGGVLVGRRAAAQAEAATPLALARRAPRTPTAASAPTPGQRSTGLYTRLGRARARRRRPQPARL